ncbi:unnamed protein product [Closterium sp. NIES-53]
MAAATIRAPVARAAAIRLLHPYCAVTRVANGCSSQRNGARSSSRSCSAVAGNSGYHGSRNACACICSREITGSAGVCRSAPAHVPRALAEVSARAAVAASAGTSLSTLWSRCHPPRRWRTPPAAASGAQPAGSADGVAAVEVGAEVRIPTPFPLPSTFPVPLTTPLTLQQPPISSSGSDSSSGNGSDSALVEELTSEEVISVLQPLIEAQRWQRMAQAVRARTFAVVPVVEGLADLGNVSAVCRTADGLGYQNVHVITTRSYGDDDAAAAAAAGAGAGAAGVAGRGITDVWSGGGTYGKEYLSWEFESDSDDESDSGGAAVVVSGKKKKKKGRRKGGPMNMYRQSARVSMGSDKWLHVETWDTTGECLQELKKRGYRIAVTSLSDRTVPIYDVDWTIPTAIVFGNEHRCVPSAAAADSAAAAAATAAATVHTCCCSLLVPSEHSPSLFLTVACTFLPPSSHSPLYSEQQRILLANFALRHRGFRSRSVVEHLVHTRAKAAAQHAAALAAAAAAAHSSDAAATVDAADAADAAECAAAGRGGGESRLGSRPAGASARRLERLVGEERGAGAVATEVGSDPFAAAAAAAAGVGSSGIR